MVRLSLVATERRLREEHAREERERRARDRFDARIEWARARGAELSPELVATLEGLPRRFARHVVKGLAARPSTRGVRRLRLREQAALLAVLLARAT